MRQIIGYAISLVLLANALAMIFAPLWWYQTLPNVSATGPFNAHFVRDTGCAYLICAGGLFAALQQRSWGWGAAMAGAAWLAAHASMHLWDAVSGRAEWLHLA